MEEKKKIVIYVDEVRELAVYPELDPCASGSNSGTLVLHILLRHDKAEEVAERIYKEYLKK